MAITPTGYRIFYKPKHPGANQQGYLMEHREVMSNAIGRPLTAKEVVHHINGNKLDNRIENLQLLSGQGAHRTVHKKKDSERRPCKICGKPERCLELCESHYNKMRRGKGLIKVILYEVTCACCGKWIKKQSGIDVQLCRKCHRRFRCDLLIPCSVCGAPQRCRQLCEKHYAQMRHLAGKRKSRAKPQP